MAIDLPAGPEYLTSTEYARLHSRTKATVCRWIKVGSIRAQRLGNAANAQWMIPAGTVPPADGRGKYDRSAIKAAALDKARAL